MKLHASICLGVLGIASSAQFLSAAESSKGSHKAMESMCTDLNDLEMTGDIDRDFALMMIPHHASAVKMASMYLKEGKDPELRSLALKIVDGQIKEIKFLETWLQQKK